MSERLVLKYMVLTGPSPQTDYWKQRFALDATSNDSPATSVYRKTDNIDTRLIQRLTDSAMLFTFVSGVIVAIGFLLPFGRRQVAAAGVVLCLITALGGSEKYSIYEMSAQHLSIEDEVSFLKQYPGKYFDFDLQGNAPYKYKTLEKHDTFETRMPWSTAIDLRAIGDLSFGLQTLLFLSLGTFALALALSGRRQKVAEIGSNCPQALNL